MRTFIAIPLPPESQEMLGQLQQGLRALALDVRWTAIPSIHLTLKFLGEVNPAELPRLSEELRAAVAPVGPFSLLLHGLGGFPNLHTPRVLWCGVEGEISELESLQKQVENACIRAGYAPEERPFHPHLTLGRVQGKRNLHRLQDYITIASESESAFSVDHLNIYRSVLTPQGPIYSILERIELSK